MCCWRRQHPRCQSKQRGHRCADGSPDYRQAAAQTALSAQYAYHTAVCPAGLSLSDWPPPSTWIGCTNEKKKTTKTQQTFVVRFNTQTKWHITTERKNVRGLFPLTFKCLRLVNIKNRLKITGTHVLHYLALYSEKGHNFFCSSQHYEVLLSESFSYL